MLEDRRKEKEERRWKFAQLLLSCLVTHGQGGYNYEVLRRSPTNLMFSFDEKSFTTSFGWRLARKWLMIDEMFSNTPV